MTVFLVIILIALAFGFVFAKLDSLTKTIKIVCGDIRDLQEQFEKIDKAK